MAIEGNREVIVEHLGDADNNIGNGEPIIERLGVDPAAAFGDAPREWVAPDNGGDAGTLGSDGGDDSGEPGHSGGSRDSDEFERNPDGSVRRNKDGSPRRKRGRRAGFRGLGGSSSGKASTRSPSVSGIEAVLLSLHAMGAAALKTPELQLDKDEAHGLATAMAEVARHYPTTIDPKTLAWVNLTFALCVCYGPRFYLIAERKKEERAKNVTPKIPTPVAPPMPTPAGAVPSGVGNDPDAKVPKAPPGTAFAGLL